ncbi:SUKH-4 family immunity protein [Streptomyces sp. NPDC056716]|uniref:SUKH-4 family immunity protein n=1 Tax=unclassified Streptomyces TaxID=2593676 RepID=UPI0036C8DA1B
MVTFAQAQERAEEWVNGELPSYQHREVRVREFDLGFVVWAEDRPDGPRSDGGAQRLVIARDSGEATLWPSLPVGEVIRRYEEEYGGVADAVPAAAPGAVRVDLNQTSFLLTPPEWLQEAADKLGIGDRRTGGGGADSGAGAGSGAGARASGSGSGGAGGSSGSGSPGGALAPTQAGVPVGSGVPGAPAGATPWAGTDTNADGGEDRSVPLPVTVFAPPLSGADDEDTPLPVAPEAATALMSGGSQLPPTVSAPALDDSDGGSVVPPGAVPPGVVAPGAASPSAVPPGAVPPGGTPPPAPTYGYPQGVSGPQGPGVPGTPASGTPAPGTPGPGGASYGRPPGAPPAGTHAGDIADAATSKAGPPPRRGGRGLTPPPPPPPPGAPGMPGARPGAGGAPPPPGVPGVPGGSSGGSSGGYVPTQMVPSHGAGVPGVPSGAGAWPPPSVPPGGPAAPGAPGAPGASQGAVHYEETVLSGPPVRGPGVPPPPQAPGAPGAPGVRPGAPQPVPGQQVPMPPPMQMPGQPPAYGYPQQGQPTVGPGYQAVLRYRAQDGSEQQVIRRSAPGTPHPEWQIFHELRAMNVPPDQVLELHTELESCELPGAYCARMIREQWPQARITSIAPYGTDHPSRQQGMRQLLAHQGELHQVADGPARPGPVRAPLPPVPPAPPVPPEAVAQELAGAFGPGVFRFEQAAVSRQGVPPVVAHTLVVAGLPVDMGPFFWAQAQPGRPVPTLAELAQERGVRPAADAGSYLVMGSDFGKAICVQYGTANIVAVPVEPGPGGAAVPPQFVNTGLPEFVRCLALLGRMWRLRFGLNQEQAGRWTVDFQAQLAALDPAALGSPESWWSVLLEQMWDGLL